MAFSHLAFIHLALQVSTACRRPLQPVAPCKQVLGTDGVFLDEGLQRVHGAVTANSLMGYFVADNVFREFLEKIKKGFGFLGESAGCWVCWVSVFKNTSV